MVRQSQGPDMEPDRAVGVEGGGGGGVVVVVVVVLVAAAVADAEILVRLNQCR